MDAHGEAAAESVAWRYQVLAEKFEAARKRPR